MTDAGATRDAQRLSSDRLPHTLAFVALVAFAGMLECVKLSSLRDPEIWGHLRAGAWMLQNKTWPQSGLFSQSGALSWQDFSWLFDAAAAMAYRFAGLRALPALLLVFRFSLAIIVFLLAGGWRKFWAAAGLSAVVQVLLLSIGPTSAFVSVILFGVELLVLLEVRDGAGQRILWTLPALFFLWANLDIGFVYGIALYLVFLIVLFLEKLPSERISAWIETPSGNLPLRIALLAGGACVIASLLNPYLFHPYISFFNSEFNALNHNLPGYNAMSFRQPQDYALMLLAMAAYFALGLLRSSDLFQIGTLLGCTALAFHAQREGWLLALVSAAVIGHAVLRKSVSNDSFISLRWSFRRLALSFAALALTFLFFLVRVPRNQDALLTKVATTYPVHAADFLRLHPQPSPFFNVYKWGGFLTWYLPEYPVAIDSRRDLYPEEMESNYFKAMNADIPYRDFPPMNQGRTFLMDKAGVMGEALRGVSGFQVVYEDEISIVYSHEVKE